MTKNLLAIVVLCAIVAGCSIKAMPMPRTPVPPEPPKPAGVPAPPKPAGVPAPPKPAGVPAPPETTTVTPYPTLEAPDEVNVGQRFQVRFWLTEELLTPDVEIRPAPGSTVTEGGAIGLSLPKAEEQQGWEIDADLFAPGFNMVGGGSWSQRIRLPAKGDSEIARFELLATDQPIGSRRLSVRLFYKGRYLGSARRPIAVVAPPGAAVRPAGTAPVTKERVAPIEVSERSPAPDLHVTLLYDMPGKLGGGTIYIHSPHFREQISARFSTPPDFAPWLDDKYIQFVGYGESVRGVAPANGEGHAGVQPTTKELSVAFAQGVGRQLYERYAPVEFKRAFWTLASKKGAFAATKFVSIQITSNDPRLPWELMRPISQDRSEERDFLGIEYRLAYWPPWEEARQIDRPIDTLEFHELPTIAPRYAGSSYLPFQARELAALSQVQGFRAAGDTFESFKLLMSRPVIGIVHFSGHGEVSPLGTGQAAFSILLQDAKLDPLSWSALAAGQPLQHLFFFFNACDSGQSKALGGFVEGWGPTLVAGGASGFIGGQWALVDRSAAEFSADFYKTLSEDLAKGPVYAAQLLSQLRRSFYQTGDPTYLAYVLYGDVNLRIVAD